MRSSSVKGRRGIAPTNLTISGFDDAVVVVVVVVVVAGVDDDDGDVSGLASSDSDESSSGVCGLCAFSIVSLYTETKKRKNRCLYTIFYEPDYLFIFFYLM